MILRHLTELFQREFHEEMELFFKGELHFNRSKTIQDMFDLCLLCNLECEANLSSELLNLSTKGRIMFSGITPQRASALAYFLSNVPCPDVIKSITVIGVPRKGSFFVPTETTESTTDRAFHEYLEAYSKLSSKELQLKLREFGSNCSEAYEVAGIHGVPTTLASMQMWHVFEDWQKNVHLSMSTFISSLKNIDIEQLMMRSVPLGPSSSVLWQLIKDNELRELTFLSLRQSGLKEEDISKLSECVNMLPKLTYLDICQNDAGNALDKLSESLTSVNIEVLDLYKMNASSATMKTVLGNLPKFAKKMKRLHLHYNDMDEEGATLLAENIYNLSDLTRFTLPHPKQHRNAEAMQRVCQRIGELSKLQVLCMTPGNIPVQEFLSMLAPEMAKWSNIEQVRISAPSGCEDTVDETCSQIFVNAVASMKNLHTLKLKRIRLTVQSFEDLVKIGREKRFQKVIL